MNATKQWNEATLVSHFISNIFFLKHFQTFFLQKIINACKKSLMSLILFRLKQSCQTSLFTPHYLLFTYDKNATSSFLFLNLTFSLVTTVLDVLILHGFLIYIYIIIKFYFFWRQFKVCCFNETPIKYLCSKTCFWWHLRRREIKNTLIKDKDKHKPHATMSTSHIHIY